MSKAAMYGMIGALSITIGTIVIPSENFITLKANEADRKAVPAVSLEYKTSDLANSEAYVCPHADGNHTQDCPYWDGSQTNICPHADGNHTQDCPYWDGSQKNICPHTDGNHTSDCPYWDGSHHAEDESYDSGHHGGSHHGSSHHGSSHHGSHHHGSHH